MFQYRVPVVRDALGRDGLSLGRSGLDRRRNRDRKLGLGPSHRCGRGARWQSWCRRTDAAVARLGLLVPMPRVGGRNEGRRILADSGGAVGADRAQRADGGRDRIPGRADDGPAFHNVMQDGQISRSAQGATRLVDRAATSPNPKVDRSATTATWPRLICASGKPLTPSGTRAAPSRRGVLSGPDPVGGPPHAERRSARCVEGRQPDAAATKCCRGSQAGGQPYLHGRNDGARRARCKRPKNYCPGRSAPWRRPWRGAGAICCMQAGTTENRRLHMGAAVARDVAGAGVMLSGPAPCANAAVAHDQWNGEKEN